MPASIIPDDSFSAALKTGQLDLAYSLAVKEIQTFSISLEATQRENRADLLAERQQILQARLLALQALRAQLLATLDAHNECARYLFPADHQINWMFNG